MVKKTTTTKSTIKKVVKPKVTVKKVTKETLDNFKPYTADDFSSLEIPEFLKRK